ncbi:MAG: hypothetical protein ACP5JG_09740, partial [Anaerolineae bacterium]
MNKSRVALLVCLTFFLLHPAPTAAQQELTLGVPATGTLSGSGDESAYQIDVPAGGEHLFVILDAATNWHSYDLYIKFGALPTTTDYDVKGDLPR